MKIEVKARWLKALRSGEYKRARQELVKKEEDDEGEETILGYCCLGVLDDVMGGDCTPNDNDEGYLEPNEYGLDYGMQKELAALNDIATNEDIVGFNAEHPTRKLDPVTYDYIGFATIADYIEQHVRTED